MTFLEKLKREHPEKVGSQWSMGTIGCPFHYGYELAREKPCLNAVAFCIWCWNREMPELEPAGGGASKAVEHPAHYNAGGIECIDAIEAALACQSEPVQAFLTGQVLKYLWRWPLKGGVEDLEKARFYLERLIACAEHGTDDKGDG